jgi:hypothetical protein
VTSENPPDFDFDVAISFAGEDREYVKEIAVLLKQRGIPTFYDEDHLAEMWGEDLVEYLDDVYRKRSRYAVVFLSRHYVSKAWPSHESGRRVQIDLCQTPSRLGRSGDVLS